MGIVPLYGEPGWSRMNVVGCIEVSDYLDLIIEAAARRRRCTGFPGLAGGPEAPAWTVVDLCNQPPRSRSTAAA